jgi:hypothetical protein
LDKGGDQVRAKGKRWGQLVAAIKGLQKDGGVSHIVPKVEFAHQLFINSGVNPINEPPISAQLPTIVAY